MDSPKFHEIWVEQCEAAEHIKLRYGSATIHPEFARELPRFAARVRGLFTLEEMREHLDRIELEQPEYDPNIKEHGDFDELDGQQEEDALCLESTTAVEERAQQFALLAELLIAPGLGTS